MPLSGFHEATSAWFLRTFGEASQPQREGWPAIASGLHTLIAAPTGSGKTLAAFLWAIDALIREGLAQPLPDATRVLYVSPLKALGNDVEKNLQQPLEGIRAELCARGLPDVEVRTAVRSGDTNTTTRARLAKHPPHILVTTPESLYIMLTSESGRRALAGVRTLIVDEIHALVGDKRGAHLSLSMERLQALTGAPITRIGLSATQTPIDEVMRFLVGSSAQRQAQAKIVDCGQRHQRELSIELPRSPLEPVMANEVWSEVYDRLAALIGAHKTTLIFVNTRRMCERVAANLAERLGSERVTSHHGSLSREHRLLAEQRLKSGALSALVATASLELGIDVGAVELVVQLGSTRSISAFVQRVGRSGHFKGGVPRGMIFPQSLAELAEAVALVRATHAGVLDRVHIPPGPLDILAQQLVAATACEPWSEDALYAMACEAYPYRALTRTDFDDVLRMLADGFSTARGRRAALVHHDRINHVVRGRKHARLVAMTSGGAIPDNADYKVVLEPSGLNVGTLNEDFAIESMAGDIFQLGNTSYRILRVQAGIVRVEDARGAPPSIPFWLGEAPARSAELSQAVSNLREQAEVHFDGAGIVDSASVQALAKAFEAQGSDEISALQLAEYLGAARTALGTLPTLQRIVVERFFDEAGGMQLVLHAPFGGRVNRAFGLALRKRFCRSFNFELQAAATEDAIVISLGPMHSFPLEDIRSFLHPNSVRDLLVQALLDAPMFETRWRWNAGRALAVPRANGGKKVPAPLLRMRANDLLASVFPDQQACLENIQGDREVPDHPLVRQTIDDCLHEAMDITQLETLLRAVQSGDVAMVFRDLREPSPLACEVLSARPYAFLDDAPLEERRTQAVMRRRTLDAAGAHELGALDPAAIERVCAEAWPSYDDADELHDALCVLGFMTPTEAERAPNSAPLHAALMAQRRIARMHVAEGRWLWIAAERLPDLLAVYPTARLQPAIEAPAADRARHPEPERALRELMRGRVQCLGPVTAVQLADAAVLPLSAVDGALHALEAEGFVLRGSFRAGEPALQWCERGLLARIHRYTLERLRREIEPVTRAELMRFLFSYQHVSGGEPYRGPSGLCAAIEQLAGYAAPAVSWEPDILSARVQGYDPAWLDQLCLSGAVAWGRVTAPDTGRAARPVRTTPIALWPRELTGVVRGAEHVEQDALSEAARRTHAALSARGASFFADLRAATELLPSQLGDALAELVASGLATTDSFAGLRALITPLQRRRPRPGRPSAPAGLDPMARAGRFSLWPAATQAPDVGAILEAKSHLLLRRYGVVFRKLLERETEAPPWRDLVRVYRRMEAAGTLRGGRFVDGMSGEQFALPEAVTLLRKLRREPPSHTLIALSAADPLCLLGVILPGERVVATSHNRVLFRDGLAVAVREHGEVRFLQEPATETERWDAQVMLRKREVAASVRAYLGTSM